MKILKLDYNEYKDCVFSESATLNNHIYCFKQNKFIYSDECLTCKNKKAGYRDKKKFQALIKKNTQEISIR